MPQHDMIIDNDTGQAVREDINDALLALVGNNSGATEPATPYAYMWWYDTANGILKMRNGANNAWLTIDQIVRNVYYIGTTSGNDTITATPSPAVGAYTEGMVLIGKLGGTNGGAATLNVNGLGAKAWKTRRGSALVAGHNTTGNNFVIVYNGTEFRDSVDGIGVDVQAYNAKLAAVAGLTWAANKIILLTGTSSASTSDLSTFWATMLGLTDAATSRAALGAAANDNAILNPNFQVWNEGTSFAAMATGQFMAEMWRYNKIGAMVHTGSRSTDVPTLAQAGVLLPYSLLIDCTTVDSSIATGDTCQIINFIEGSRWADYAQKALTLSFWVKATKTGIYCVSVRNSTVDRSFVAEYTVNSADTWEFKTVSILASPSAGTWDYGTGVGAYITWALASGATFQTTAGAWQTGSYVATANQVNACDNTANDFRLAGVKLEKGSVATQIKVDSLDEAVESTLRYFEKSFDLDDAPAVGFPGGSSGGVIDLFTPNRTDRFGISGTQRFRRAKRTTPTVVMYGNAATGRIYDAGGGADRAVDLTSSEEGLRWDGASGVTTTANSNHVAHWTANARMG